MNTNTIALSPEQFIFAQDNELRTSSLKVAERFGKEHKNILRNIDNVLTQVSDSFGKLNFEPSDYEQENGLGIMTKYRSYNMTKDGFMFLVMGFTGKDAAVIKEWYISAFNQMAAKLFPTAQYGLKQLPPSRYISESEAAQFIKSIQAHCKSESKSYPVLYRKLYDHYGITTYKHIPAGKLEEAARLCGFSLLKLAKVKLPDEPFTLAFTPEQLEDLVAERIKAVEGELLAKLPEPPQNCITLQLNKESGANSLTLKFEAGDTFFSRYFICIDGGNVSIRPMADDEAALTQEQWLRMMSERGYLVVKKSEVIGKLMK